MNSIYQGVCVTNICADGIVFCQLPSRGTARLSKLLEETEVFLVSQVGYQRIHTALLDVVSSAVIVHDSLLMYLLLIYKKLLSGAICHIISQIFCNSDLKNLFPSDDL